MESPIGRRCDGGGRRGRLLVSQRQVHQNSEIVTPHSCSFADPWPKIVARYSTVDGPVAWITHIDFASTSDSSRTQKGRMIYFEIRFFREIHIKGNKPGGDFFHSNRKARGRTKEADSSVRCDTKWNCTVGPHTFWFFTSVQYCSVVSLQYYNVCCQSCSQITEGLLPLLIIGTRDQGMLAVSENLWFCMKWILSTVEVIEDSTSQLWKAPLIASCTSTLTKKKKLDDWGGRDRIQKNKGNRDSLYCTVNQRRRPQLRRLQAALRQSAG